MKEIKANKRTRYQIGKIFTLCDGCACYHGDRICNLHYDIEFVAIGDVSMDPCSKNCQLKEIKTTGEKIKPYRIKFV